MVSLKYRSLLTLVGILIGCASNPLEVDAESVALDVESVRADSLLWYANDEQTLSFHTNLIEEENEVYAYLLGQCIRIQSPQDCVVVNALNDFRRDPYMKGLQSDLDSAFSDLTNDHSTINRAFKRLRFHLKEVLVPEEIWYANTVFNSSAFSTGKAIVVGLERYLGPTNANIEKLPATVFFEWIKDDMLRTFMPRDAVASWAMTHLVKDSKESLAEAMVFWGKVLYLTEAGFYDQPNEWVLRYTKDEMDWALANERSIWNYLVEDELLFKKDERLINNLIMPGPFSVGLPEKGPDRLGQFIGWRMVHAFVEENNATVQQVLAAPYNKILQSYEID